MGIIGNVKAREHLHRERLGKLDTSFALAYAVLHQPKYAPDTRPELVVAPCSSVLGLHFSKSQRKVALAIEMCNTCVIKKECLATAVEHGITEGVWGGVHFG